MKKILLTIYLILSFASSQGQMIHSHNDYQKDVPLYKAYSAKASSVECDMYCIDGKLLVGHDKSDLDTARSFERMYLEPIATIFRCNGGQACLNDPQMRFTLMVEIKGDNPQEYVDLLAKKIEGYSDIFDPKVNSKSCGLLIGGWKFPEDFTKYPEYFKYDFQYNGCDWSSISETKLAYIGMISMNFAVLSSWRGEGDIDLEEKERLGQVIDFAHSLGKPVRFWGAPDVPSCWNLLYNMGADYINTDNVVECANFFAKQHEKRQR